MSRIRHIRYNGFTLIELIVVMIVIAILAAAVMLRLSANTQHKATTQADMLRRNLSHLQLLAISRSVRLRLTVLSGGGSYNVSSCTTSACTATTALTDPATGLDFSVNLAADGVTLSPAGTLDFDSLGRPVSGATLITTNPAYTYTLTGSGNCVDVSVRPITGFAATATPRAC